MRDFVCIVCVPERPRLIEGYFPLPCPSRACRPAQALARRRATQRLAEKCHPVPFCATLGVHRRTTKAEIMLEVAQRTAVAMWGRATKANCPTIGMVQWVVRLGNAFRTRPKRSHEPDAPARVRLTLAGASGWSTRSVTRVEPCPKPAQELARRPAEKQAWFNSPGARVTLSPIYVRAVSVTKAA